MADKTNKNFLKVQGNHLLEIEQKDDVFSLTNEQQSPSWISESNKNAIKSSDLRRGIEPWLTSLFQSEHLSLLVGSGLTIAVENLAKAKKTTDKETTNNPMSNPTLDSGGYKNEIEFAAGVIATKNNRGKANIEDHIRVINELLRGLEILGDDTSEIEENKTSYDRLNENLITTIQEFTNNISSIENNIANTNEKQREEAFDYLVNFLMSFASRTGTRERLNIFTTNYDRLIEAGAELAGLHLLDRFVGTLTPIFRSSRLDIDMHYNPPGIRGEPRYLEGVARFTKLHGSIDWINTGTDIRRIGLPFGAKDIPNFLIALGIEDADARKIMIYPNATKDRETTEYPYVELFRDFAVALCRPNSTLVTYGYGFGDDHLNRVIRDMLTIPSTHLVIISHSDMDGRIMAKYKEFGRSSQMSLIVGSGVADIKTLVDYFLPKPSIDRASMRMNELLKQRYSTHKTETEIKNNEEKSES